MNFNDRPMTILSHLNRIQHKYGYLPDAELNKLAAELKARRMDVPLYRLQELASFYPTFRQEFNDPPQNEPPFVEIKICRDMCCHLAGAVELLLGENGLRHFEFDDPQTVVKEIDTTRQPNALGNSERNHSKSITVEGVSCLGRCDRAPVVCVSRHVYTKGGLIDHDKSFQDRVYAGLTPNELKITLEAIITADNDPPEDTPDRLRNIEHDEWLIDIYSHDSALCGQEYALVKKYLKEFPVVVSVSNAIKTDQEKLKGFIKTSHPWLAKLDTANILGMGGAGGRAYEKWRDVWAEPPGTKYIVCNGDESEPGTFKDRELLFFKPHLVVEGVILAGLITGASEGYIYIRHEYSEQIDAVQREIRRAVSAGVCGENILNTQRSFKVEVLESPGGYICGEQSALIEAMEDKRAQPRNRPPELQTNGLFDKPTIVNNVETLAWVPAIMQKGGDWYAGQGNPHCKGRRLFSISGDLHRPGVFEVPIGTTLGELIDKAGRMKGELKAVAPSGPSGGFLPALLPVKKGVAKRLKDAVKSVRDPDEGKLLSEFAEQHLLRNGSDVESFRITHMPLDLNFFRNIAKVIGLGDIELMLGAGLVVYNCTRNMLEHARNCTQFFRNESCGKCVPCRIGSQKLVEISTEMLRKRDAQTLTLNDCDGREDGENSPQIPKDFWDNDVANVNEFAKAMRLTSICGLGYVAPNPLNTVLQFFKSDVENLR